MLKKGAPMLPPCYPTKKYYICVCLYANSRFPIRKRPFAYRQTVDKCR